MQQLLLAPALVFQAAQVIRRTPRLPEAQGPRAGTSGQGPPLRLLILGDSSAAGVGAATQQQALSGQLVQQLAPKRTVSWRLVARTGLTTAAMAGFLERADQAPFDIAVTALGVNDATRLVGPARWVAHTRKLHAMLRMRHAVRRIYVTAMPPLDRFPALPRPTAGVVGAHGRVMMAALAADLAQQPDVEILRPDWEDDPALMASDGFHPGPAIYHRWGAYMARHILRDLEIGPP